MRGYLVYKPLEPVLIDLKLNKHIDYFKSMKHRMEETAAIKIQYYVRKKINKLKKKKRRESKKSAVFE